MSSIKKNLPLQWAAEFVVIVVGVLVALGVDSWASERSDRVLERDYLERLLDDVRYDLREACRVPGADDAITVLLTVCEFDHGSWSAESLPADILSAAGQQRMQLAKNIYGALSGFAGVLAVSAEELQALIEEEISHSERGTP